MPFPRVTRMRRMLLSLVLLAGCAHTAPQAASDESDPGDRYEALNRQFYAVNDTLDRATLHPAAVAYRDTAPAPVRRSLHNVLSDMANPAQFANDVLQGKPKRAGTTFMRFLINTTVGGLGLFDVATGWGYPDHDTDFGVTLALWGVPSGPFLFLPVLGPTNPRDAVGFGANSALDPLTWASFGGSATLGVTRFAVGAVDGRARVLADTDAIKKTALDPYATFRSLATQHRAAQIEATRKDDAVTAPSWSGDASAK